MECTVDWNYLMTIFYILLNIMDIFGFNVRFYMECVRYMEYGLANRNSDSIISILGKV